MSRVDYDISYVDQVYLPVAMAPLGNPDVGRIGTVQGLTGFRAVLTRFLADRPGWPTYRGDPPYPGPRIPGAYNVLVGGPDLTAAGATVDAMRALYAHCTTAAGDDEPCPAIRAVDDLFRRNYAHYLTLDCAPHATLTADSLLRHVHGWVPFNRNCTGGAAANPLQETPGVDYPAAVGHYLALQYLPSGAFNPYVGLIHDAGYLGMSAYAFSIDDAVGNMNESGDGLIVVVGGPQGLVNPRPYDRKALIHVNLGQPGSGRPAWSDYGICTDRPDRAINPAFPSFQVATVAYPCTISLSDSRDRVYRFVIANPPPDPAVRCDAGATGDMLAWCRAVTPDGDGTAWYLDTPPPLD